MRRMPELDKLRGDFVHWEVVKDLSDQLIDLMLNHRQSGHPGGSRSKAHALVALCLSGAMRWDIRDPSRRFADRFILSAGHTTPLGYALLTVLNEAMRLRHARTGDDRFRHRLDDEFVLGPSDLPGFRNIGGLPGHAEMAGKTLFYKWNTGPSGHGSAAMVGQALALRYVGAEDVMVWGIEGEGGLTAGVNHEAMNSAWGLGLSNLCLLVDWNDFGIDPRPASAVVYGTPQEWFEAHGWDTYGTELGSEWEGVASLLASMVNRDLPPKALPAPRCGWLRTRKGRGYLLYDNASHGAPHKQHSNLFWETKRPFQERYGVTFEGFGEAAPDDAQAREAQLVANIDVVMGVLRDRPELVDALSDRLVEIAETVPEAPDGVWIDFNKNPLDDPELTDYERYPLYLAPGAKAPNRKGLANFGAWANSLCRERYGRPLFLATSADLADSTNISGFAKGHDGVEGWGWYERVTNPRGALLPQEITEFTNAGLMCALASVNFDARPFERFNGFFGAASTYGSFSYLKYGMARLFSQVAQDSELQVGKFLWVAGHTGTETAEDSRTHFGVFAPGVTQLFPRGQVLNLHPWEYNEVPVLLGRALQEPQPIIVLHLTRPGIPLPDREALGMESHFAAARGAYLIRDFRADQPPAGTVIVQGTMSTHNLVRALPELDARGLNVRVVAAVSPELFALQPAEERERVLPWPEWQDSMIITNGALRNMNDWVANKVVEEYSLSADWDDRWRSGGSLDEVCEEAHISQEWILKGIERFVAERGARRARLGLS
jgi:transketolase